MSEWKEYFLGELCLNVTSGGTPKSTDSTNFNPPDFPWLKTKEVNFNRIYETEYYISQKGFDTSSVKLIPKDSIIVAMYGQGDTAGRVALNKIPLTTNQACCNLTIDQNKADVEYVFYYMWTLYSTMVHLKNGGAQPNLNAGIIKGLKIILPSISEQHRIASILSTLDSKIECNRKICANLEAQAQALFKHWFIDFAPFKDGKFVESELGMIPEGWRVGTLGELCTQITDGVHNTVQDDNNSSYLLLSAKNIKNGVINISDNERHISEDTFSILRKRTKLSKSDILLTSVGTLGELCYLNEEPSNIEFQRSVAILKADNNKTHGLWLYHCLKSQIRKVVHLGHGAVQQCIFIGDLKDYQVVIPPKVSIDIFVDFICLNQDLQTKLRNENRRLSTLRDTLLPKLMSGQIKL